jgi:hypothetical protein
LERAGVKDTTAYKITRQVMDHVYGDDEKLSSDEFVAVFNMYLGRKGSWEGIMAGDMKNVEILEGVLESFVNYRRAVNKAGSLR